MKKHWKKAVLIFLLWLVHCEAKTQIAHLTPTPPVEKATYSYQLTGTKFIQVVGSDEVFRDPYKISINQNWFLIEFDSLPTIRKLVLGRNKNTLSLSGGASARLSYTLKGELEGVWFLRFNCDKSYYFHRFWGELRQ